MAGKPLSEAVDLSGLDGKLRLGGHMTAKEASDFVENNARYYFRGVIPSGKHYAVRHEGVLYLSNTIEGLIKQIIAAQDDA